MGDWLIMNGKERKRKVILEDVRRGRLKLKDATPKLGVGYRQAKRLLARYRLLGDVGLIHGGRGKRSSHAYPSDFKEAVLKRYEASYFGFGPTFAAEKLLENERLSIHRETLRLWLLEAGLWKRARRRKAYRQRRARRERFGELVQIDGSDHKWFGESRGRSCLLNMVDDATGTTLSQLDSGETCQVLLSTFKRWVEKYGVPKSVYVDLKSVYVSAKRRIDNELESTTNVFERVCKLLDVVIIKAYSPQAKGRVERNHGVYQDRFVKELQLKGITSLEEANIFLEGEYLDKINERFAKAPTSLEDAHCSTKAYGDLEQIFCWEYTREVRQDFTVRFKNEFFQLNKAQRIRIRPKQKVYVRVHLDNSLSIWRKDKRLQFEKITQPVKKTQKIKREFSSARRSEIARKNKIKTPWNGMPPGWLSPKTYAKQMKKKRQDLMEAGGL